MAGIGLLPDGAPAHAGADHRHMLAGAADARRQGGHGRIDAAGHHLCSGQQTELFGDGRQQAADHLGRIDQALGHHARRDAQRIEHLSGPVARRHVVHAADIAGRTMVDRHLAAQQVVDIAVRRQQIARALPDGGLLVFQPQHLGVAVITVDAIAGDRVQPFQVDMLLDPFDFRRWRAGPSRSGMGTAAAWLRRRECRSRRTGCSRKSP